MYFVMIYNDNMGKVEKIIDKFRRSLAGHSFNDCEKVLLSMGYKIRKSKGSHCQFSKDKNYITIANHKPVSKDAVKDVLKAWDEINE